MLRESLSSLVLLSLVSSVRTAIKCQAVCYCTEDTTMFCGNLSEIEVEQVLSEEKKKFDFREKLAITKSVPRNYYLSIEQLNLKVLNINKCGLKKVHFGEGNWSTLIELNLSSNALNTLDIFSGVQSLSNLRTLDLSHNHLTHIDVSVLSTLNHLELLDLSFNHLRQHLDEEALLKLPKALRQLRLADNELPCSPSSSWLHSLLSLRPQLSLDAARCHYGSSSFTGDLALVAFYYSVHVLPKCPLMCNCLITFVQERVVRAPARVYSVDVSCVDANLSVLPVLPPHTRKLNLAQNLIGVKAFETLDVGLANYDEIDFLVLDNNDLQALPIKLSQMKLELGISAKNNRISTIPYVLSQHLLKMSTGLNLSGNPWRCTCQSQITDLSLLARVTDAEDLECGPASPAHLRGLKICEVSRDELCPPASDESPREHLLRLTCVLLALLVLLVLTRLAIDSYKYYTKGEVPTLAMKLM